MSVPAWHRDRQSIIVKNYKQISPALNSFKVSTKPFTIIEANLSGSSLVFRVDDLYSEMGREVVGCCPKLQQALDELVQVEFLLFMFLTRPQLPEGPGSEGPEEAGGGWRLVVLTGLTT